ncbi:MAG: xanthine dehydrogenase family protein molybdopterin-binding subunit [Actinomycetota bacterium]
MASGTSERTQMLSGSATYLADLRHPLIEGAAHAIFVRATAAHARFQVDADAARRAPGVLAVLTAEDNPIHPTIAYAPIHPPRFAQPLLAEQKVRHVGEAVAVVVAETEAEAIDAAELVVVEYEDLPVVQDLTEATKDEVLLFGPGEECRRNAHSAPDDSTPTNVIRTEAADGIATGSDPARFADAEVVVDVEVVNPRQVAAPIECRGAIAAWTASGDLHAWVSTQTPHGFRSRIAPMYDLALSQIHVIAGPFVGGGFGGKGAPGPEEQLVPLLARQVGRPVRWIERRGENLVAAPQGRAEELIVRLAGTAQGVFEAIRVEHRKDAGAYPSSGAGLPNNWTWPMSHGSYRIEHVEYEQQTVVTNRPPVSALRGAGRGPVIAAIERAVDRYAAAIDMDPAELRARNLLTPEEMPYLAPTGFTLDDADYPSALARALERSGYASLRSDQATRRADGSVRQLGIGVACYNHRTCGGGGESAAVRINTDGSATVVTGTTSQGQDHEGTWRSIASEELGIDPDSITVIEGVTDEISTGVGAIGSRSVQTAGLAIHEAAADVVDQARQVAAAMLEAAPADVVLDREHGTFHVIGTPSRSLAWAEIAVELDTRNEKLACDHIYENDGRDVFPSGTHVAVVEVDTETGAWELLRFIGVDDAGVRINEAAVEGQLHGGIALGVAQVLGEASTFDEYGQPTAGSFLDYSILSIDQVPQYELEPQVVPSSFNARGYKAVGESGPIGATAAVHNAVLDAVGPLGVDHVDLPVTPQRLWAAIDQA